MRALILMGLMFLVAGRLHSQCDIESVKPDSYGLRVYKSGGASQNYQYDGKSLYDYSSCWVAVLYSAGVLIYDGKSISTFTSFYTNTSEPVKSLKVIGNNVRLVYENGQERTFEIK